jgi:plastocyanin
MRLPVLILALGMVAVACSSNKTTTSGQSSSPAGSPSQEESSGILTINGEKANDHGTKDFSGQPEASVEMDDEFYFEPTVLKGTAGQTLTIELENEGSLPHNFTLEAQSLDQDVQPGQKGSVMVTFPQSGIVEFFCRFHRGSGMIGELSV